MFKILRGLASGLLVLGSLVPLALGDQIGQAQGDVLYGYGARGTALGGAFTGLADDAFAAHWNPAGLGLIKTIDLALAHARLGDQRYQDNLIYLQPMLGAGTMALELSAYNQWDTAGHYEDTQVSAAYAKELLPGWSVGLNAKLDHERSGVLVGTAATVDLGVLYRFPKVGIGLGASLQNLIPMTVTLGALENQFPRVARFGLAASPIEAIRLVADIDQTLNTSDPLGWGAGLELVPWSVTPVRVGYREQTLTFGLGLHLRELQLDYAMVRPTDLEARHYLTLSFELGTYNAVLSVEPKMFSNHSMNKTCTVTLDLPESRSVKDWKFTITQVATTKVVKTFQNGPVPETLVWDGKDNQEQFLPEGKYQGEVTGKDAEGHLLRSNLIEMIIFEPVNIKVSPEKEGKR